MNKKTQQWIAQDKQHAWHPFTPQEAWCDPEHEPLIIERGEGVWLIDSEGRRYIDGNSSIWTNLHGHNHPVINAAITDQLGRIAHSSYLGFGNPLASELATRLCGFFPQGTLERCFFSDDGSTALECAFKMALQYREQSGQPEKDHFIVFDQAYHGDTLGAASLGGVKKFSAAARRRGFESFVVAGMDELQNLDEESLQKVAAVVIEPLVQGVNQIRPWPKGMLSDLRAWCDERAVHLILDEVMTGFGRTGEMFACQNEEVIPDFLCLAKGLTGGYMPLAATLTTEAIYSAFLGGTDRAFYYGHSYTANQLGCAAAMASLDLFESEGRLAQVRERSREMSELLKELESLPMVYEVRQVGLVSGIELRRPDGTRFLPEENKGRDVCLAARQHGLLTRPINDTIVLMPPLSICSEELQQAVSAIRASI